MLQSLVEARHMQRRPTSTRMRFVCSLIKLMEVFAGERAPGWKTPVNCDCQARMLIKANNYPMLKCI